MDAPKKHCATIPRLIAAEINLAKIEMGTEIRLESSMDTVSAAAIPFRTIFMDHVRSKIADSEKTKKIEFNFRLVYEEVLSNAVKHAHQFSSDKSIHIKLSIHGKGIQLEVSDESGKFFDPRDPNEPANSMRFRTGLEDWEAMMNARKEARHDPARPDGHGGRGVLHTEKFSDGAIYEPFLIDGKVVGTRVRVQWNLE